jgi:glutamate dehydrogenase (NAD(P)+)
MDMGAKIVAVSDVFGGAKPTNASGYFEGSYYQLADLAKRSGSVSKIPSVEAISNQELLESEADILIPAALENQITERNASKIIAKLVVEAANGPTTPMGDKILEKNGLKIVPDILANSGGVLVSYFEWVQNLARDHWSEETVNERLEEKMKKAFHDVFNYSEKHNVDMRRAALVLAVGRVVSAMQLSGWH